MGSRRFRASVACPAGPFRRLQSGGKAAGEGTCRNRRQAIGVAAGRKNGCSQLSAAINSSSGSESAHAKSVHPRKSRRREYDERKQMPGDERGSRNENASGPVESRLVAESVEPGDTPPKLSPVQPHGRGVQLRRGVQETRPRCPEEGHRSGDDDVAGLVAGRLRPLRSALHSDGVAQRRHLPHRRRPGRRGLRQPAAPRPQQLARQCEPRQGPAVALADQAEVRPETLVGRSDGLRRELCPGVDGVQDVRVRRRAGGHLGAGIRH